MKTFVKYFFGRKACLEIGHEPTAVRNYLPVTIVKSLLEYHIRQ